MHRQFVRRDEIVKWVTKHSGPPVETLRRMADFQKAKKQNVYVVAFFDEFEVGYTGSQGLQGSSGWDPAMLGSAPGDSCTETPI